MHYRIGVFATGRGQGSRGLLAAIHEGIRSGHLPAEIAFVFSNRDPGEFEATDGFFDQVRACGYPLITASFRKFRAESGGSAGAAAPGDDWRLRYDRLVMDKLAPFAPDLCVLAGYLLIFGPELPRRFTLVNLHPAAPGGPTGLWQDVIWQLIGQGAAQSGNTMFYVTEDLDRGPIVAYSTFPIRGAAFDPLWKAVHDRTVKDLRDSAGEDLPLFKAIREHGMARERPLVVETLKAFAEGRARVSGGRIVDSQGKPANPLDLTPRIEALVAAAN